MQSKKTLTTMVFLAAVALSGSASASTYNVLTPVDQALYVNLAMSPVGSFSDTYNFTIDSQSDMAASATNYHLPIGTIDVLDISNLNMSIFNAANNLLASSSSGFSVFGTVPAGEYHALVTGNGHGASGGSYVISLATSYVLAPAAVPVPAAAWLLGSGLIGLIGVAHRNGSKANGDLGL